MLHLLLLVFAFVFLILEAAKVGLPRLSFGWLGLALLVLSMMPWPTTVR